MREEPAGIGDQNSCATGPNGKPAGAKQALILLSLNSMPILASASLVPSLPTFLKHFADVPGAPYLVPMIITLPTLCIGIFSTFAGILADRLGRRRMILSALTVFVICGIAPIFFENLLPIFACRLALGLAEACTLTAGNALMGDYFAGEERRKWLSYEMVIGPVVGAAVLLVSGALATWWWRAPFAIYAMGAIILFAAFFLLWEPSRRAQMDRVETASGFPWATATLVAFGAFLVGLPYFTQNTQHGRIFAGLGVDTPIHISLLAMVSGLGTIAGAITFRRLPPHRIARSLILVFGLYGLAYIILSFRPPLAAGLALDVIGQFACGMGYPALLSWSLSSFAPQYRGRGVGIWSGCFYVSSFLAGLLVGLIDQHTHDFMHSLGVVGLGCATASLLLLVGQIGGLVARRTGRARAAV